MGKKNLQKWLKTYFFGIFEGGAFAPVAPPGSATVEAVLQQLLMSAKKF